jgi:hypothetical protein
VYSFHEKVVKKEVYEVVVLIERLFDVTKKSTSNDASSAPHESDTAHVKLPAKVMCRFSHQHKALRV